MMLSVPQAGRASARNGAWQGCHSGRLADSGGGLTLPKAQRVVERLAEILWRAGSCIAQGEDMNRVVMCWRSRSRKADLAEGWQSRCGQAFCVR